MSGFRIYNKALSIDKYIRNNIAINIPSIKRDIRIHMLDNSYNLIENITYAMYNKGNIRIKYIINTLVNISMLDYLIGNIRELKDTNKKHIDYILNNLADLKTMISSWRITEENGKKAN